MRIAKRIRELAKRIAFGPVRPAQRFFLGQDGAQKEISVWLHGMGVPLDVTSRHSLACAVPLTICIAFEKDRKFTEKDSREFSLRFCERGGDRRLLGKIGLRHTTTISTSGPQLFFFEIRSAKSYCLPRLRMWTFYLHHAYSKWRKPPAVNIIKMSHLEMRAMDIIFICPRPIGVASAMEDSRGNMFPLNVMGPLADGYFGFALKDARFPAHLVSRTRRVSLTTVPIQQGDLAYSLGPNHSKNGIEWHDLPFDTKPSPEFHIPIPTFAMRVRELEVEIIQRFGTHIFFAARIVRDERFTEGVEWCVVHGHYQAWRLKTRRAEAAFSIAEDARIKRGADPNLLLL